MKISPISVLCVDDNDLVAEGLRIKLTSAEDFHWIGHLATAEQLVETAYRLQPQVVLLDIDMPGRDPFQALQQLSELLPSVRVVMLSGYVQHGLIDRAIESGAWGYVSKHQGADSILSAIRQVAQGEFTLGHDVEEEYRRH